VTAYEARVALAILAGRDPYAGKAAYVWHGDVLVPIRAARTIVEMRQRGWVSDFGGEYVLRRDGREALACWLLRGLR
jgi:hypothetical protein